MGDGSLPSSFLASKQVATRNILSPLLWLCAIVTPSSFAAAIFGPASLSTVFFITGLVPPAFVLAAYTYWTFKDPDRLQSEEFVTHKRWVDSQLQIGDNRTNEVIEIAASEVTLTANTAPQEVR